MSMTRLVHNSMNPVLPVSRFGIVRYTSAGVEPSVAEVSHVTITAGEVRSPVRSRDGMMCAVVRPSQREVLAWRAARDRRTASRPEDDDKRGLVLVLVGPAARVSFRGRVDEVGSLDGYHLRFVRSGEQVVDVP